MKNFTCLILLFLSVSFLNKLSAQFNYGYYWALEVDNLLGAAKKFSDTSVSEVKIHSIYKKKVRNTIYKFNDKGYLTEFYKGKKDDSTEKKALVYYDEKNRIKSAKYYKKHKVDLQFNFVHNEKDKLTEFKRMNEDCEIVILRNFKYNNDGFIEESTQSFKNSSETKLTWKYEYYDKGKISHSYFYKKGKLKREYDYMCKEEGEQVTRKNLNKVCQWYETNKDTLTAIYQNTDDKGKVRKTIYKYTVKDTLILAEIHYTDKNQLQLKITYDKSHDKQLSYTYYKKGKPGYSNQTTYHEDKITSVTHMYKGKLSSKEEYAFNESNQLTSSKSYNKKEKIIGEMNVTYTKR